MRAGVQHVRSELDTGKQRPVTVNVVDGEQHRLQPLDAAVLLDVTAAAGRVLAVHREQTAEDDVSVDVGGRRLGGFCLGGGWTGGTQALPLTALDSQLLAATTCRQLRRFRVRTICTGSCCCLNVNDLDRKLLSSRRKRKRRRSL